MCKTKGKNVVVYIGTVDGSEIPNNSAGCTKTLVNNGIHYQLQQMVNAGLT